MRALKRAWYRIQEPRTLKVFYLAVYLLAVWVGMVTLINPPTSIEGALGSAITAFWAGFIVIGGVGAALTVLPGWWWVEKLSVWLILCGIAIYQGVVIWLHIAGAEGSSRLTQAGFIAFAALLFILRLILTRKWDFEPRRLG